MNRLFSLSILSASRCSVIPICAAVWQSIECASYNLADMASTSASSDSAAWRAIAESRDDSEFRLRAGLVLVLAAVLFFARLGARALWSSEFRWAEISREMIVTHNYFWPTINGHVYYDKPLGSYWLVIPSTRFTGGLDEAATRLPCAIAGLAGSRTADSAGATPLRRSHRGAVRNHPRDQLQLRILFAPRQPPTSKLLTGELAALLLFDAQSRTAAAESWVVGLWLIMAATSLTKGLLGFALPMSGDRSLLMPARRLVAIFRKNFRSGPLAERMRRLIERNRWFFNWYTIAGIGLAGPVYYMPFEISRAHDRHAKGPRDGLSRERRALLPSVRPSRADLSYTST